MDLIKNKFDFCLTNARQREREKGKRDKVFRPRPFIEPQKGEVQGF